MAINATFNGTSLQTNNFIVANVGHSSVPSRKIYSQTRARRDGEIISAVQNGSKIVKLTGTFRGSSINDLDSRIDTLKKALVGVNKILDIDWNGGSRRYIATYQGFELSGRDKSPSSEVFTLSFMVPEGFGVDLSTSSILSLSGLTSSSTSTAVTIGGSADWQTPVYTITVASLSGGSTNTISLANSVTGTTLSIVRAFTGGDVITVDTDLLEVKLNGTTLLDYAGAWPTFQPGTGASIVLSDDFSARSLSLNMSIKYKWS